MAQFDMMVDTNPMAATMATVGASVLGVTGAVVAMQSAVVAQEEQAARDISANVDRGFYMLMKSQISQKMASLAAEISSKILLMKKFRADIVHMKDLMTGDYNRICRRYKRQFGALDKEAETRVRELDQKAVEVAAIYNHFNSTRTDSSSMLFLCSDEAIRMNVLETTSAVKSKTNRALDAMAANVESTLKYNKAVSHILKPPLSQLPCTGAEAEQDNTSECKEYTAKAIVATNKVEQTYVSALVTEAMSMFDKNSIIANVYLPQSEHLKGGEFIEREVRETDSSFDWQEVNAEDKAKVRQAFTKQIEAANTSERVALEMKRLFDESLWSVPRAAGGAV